MVRVQVPATLKFRDVALRVVSAACKLVGPGLRGVDRTTFRIHVVSAFGEAFNNVVLHGYGGSPEGIVDVEIDTDNGGIRIYISDQGAPFDIDSIPTPDLATLPEKGMGIFIIRSFMDEVTYKAGTPNVLLLAKSLKPNGEKGHAHALQVGAGKR